MTYKVGSLFAGVGGVCLGFKQAGCKVVWANEIDENACKTYALNHTQTTLIKGDVRTLHDKNLAKIDILTAGFPCQPFSQAGKGRGFADPRGQLFFEIPKLLSKLSPKAYFLENVKTLATQSGGAVFAAVREALVGAGYSFIPFVLNAAAHSGVPQGRERIYIVGFRGEVGYFFAKTTKSNSNSSEFFGKFCEKFTQKLEFFSKFGKNSQSREFCAFFKFR